jgi:membrane-bound lytic murein transglycosylase A
MQAIRAYLKSHPQDQETVLNTNLSYVFFKIETDGPLGNLNVPLTPGRSIAVDKKIFPPAALMYIQTQKPAMTEAGQLRNWEEFGRFALNQDTGGAITGPGRADVFWGNGLYAELAAGHLQHRGDMYFLILKPAAM